MLTPDWLRGVWGTVLVPWDERDRIDVERLHRQLDVLTTSGLDGVYAHGTAGEFHELDDEEWDQINAAVAERCRAVDVPFQLGAGHMSMRVCLRRIARARAHRPAAIQVILPDWVPLVPDEAVAGLAAMASAAQDAPLVLYNPPHAKTRLPPDVLGRLAREVPQLIGVKVAGGDGDWYRQMRPHVSRLAVFVPGHLLASGLRQGAAGAYSNVACMSPRGAADWYAMMRTDPDRALDVQERLNCFFAEHIFPLQREGYANPALDKTLAHIGGWCDVGTRVRPPYRWVAAERAAALRTVARAAVPELFPASQ